MNNSTYQGPGLPPISRVKSNAVTYDNNGNTSKSSIQRQLCHDCQKEIDQ